MKKWNIVFLFVTFVGGLMAMEKKGEVATIGFHAQGPRAKDVTDRLLKRYNEIFLPEQKGGAVQVAYSKDNKTVEVSLEPDAGDIKKIVTDMQKKKTAEFVRIFIFNTVESVTKDMVAALSQFKNLQEICIFGKNISRDAITSLPKSVVRIFVKSLKKEALNLSSPGNDWLDYDPAFSPYFVLWARKSYWKMLADQHIEKHGEIS